MRLSVSIYDKRIDSVSYHGFYHATFDVEYHFDVETEDTLSTIIIDKTELVCVDFTNDAELRAQMTLGSISNEMKEYIFTYLDVSTLKEKVFDKACL